MTPSTPPSPKAGWSRPEPTPRAATWPKKPSISAAWSRELLPGEPEALGLLALMLYAEARREARRNARGELRRARGAGHDALGCRNDRAGRSRPAARQRNAADRPLSAGGRNPIGARGAASHGREQLAGGRQALQRAVRAHRFAGGRASIARSPLPSGRTGPASRRCNAVAPTRALANTSPTGPRAPNCWRAPARLEEAARLRDRHRPGARSGGPPVS